ncbi:hypothetical protein Ahy_B04g069854 [Arachis hypogaea]|uniref:peroxidase n=1 Tax=Arachis hypogaea TaxID=3818 RepID=A0A444ZDP9_ARAHY|nr:hypothetical protein Ahy_B04g069854 [Arachis hypogaea]
MFQIVLGFLLVVGFQESVTRDDNLASFIDGASLVYVGLGPSFGEDNRFFDKVKAAKRKWEKVVGHSSLGIIPPENAISLKLQGGRALIHGIMRQPEEGGPVKDKRLFASLIRLYFHDCLIQGCDASILLNDTAAIKGEQLAPPNINSIRRLDVVNLIKKKIEKICPRVVSCVDILALITEMSSEMSKGPNWQDPLGRKDSITTNFDLETSNIPGPTSNLPQLNSKFEKKGLDVNDLVALSAVHQVLHHVSKGPAKDKRLFATAIKCEQLALPTINSIRRLDVVNLIKKKIEKICPGVVSCVDILALATEMSSEMSKGPNWQVSLGRRDSITTNFDLATSNIPGQTSNLPQLISKFEKKGFDVNDLVALSDGCDASILLNDTAAIKCEQLAPPTINSIRRLDVVNLIKKKIEKICPGVVSCVDILALATEMSSEMSKGPNWQVPLGRKDSITTNFDLATSNILGPTSNLPQLISKFEKKGLDVNDLVALSGPAKDKRLFASLIRLAYHDCFVQGCDASILLNDTAAIRSEQLAPPNINSVRRLDVVNLIKKKIEKTCPGVVSCVDILALAAEISSEIFKVPNLQVPLGKRDNITANFDLTTSDILGPTSNLPQLIYKFEKKDLDVNDLVALSVLIQSVKDDVYFPAFQTAQMMVIIANSIAHYSTISFLDFQGRLFEDMAKVAIPAYIRTTDGLSRSYANVLKQPNNSDYGIYVIKFMESYTESHTLDEWNEDKAEPVRCNKPQNKRKEVRSPFPAPSTRTLIERAEGLPNGRIIKGRKKFAFCTTRR